MSEYPAPWIEDSVLLFDMKGTKTVSFLAGSVNLAAPLTHKQIRGWYGLIQLVKIAGDGSPAQESSAFSSLNVYCATKNVHLAADGRDRLGSESILKGYASRAGL